MGLDCPRCGLEGDYIPGGKTADEVTNIRQVPSGHFARCGAATCHDVQSGPIFCGDRADWMADTDGGVVFVCKRHKGRLTDLLPGPKPVEKEVDWYD